MIGLIKKILKNGINMAERMFSQVENNTHESTKKCFKALTNAHIKLCFTNTKQPITDYKQIKDIDAGNIDISSERAQATCLSEFYSKGVTVCPELILPESTEL